jgi:hypothetical protein
MKLFIKTFFIVLFSEILLWLLVFFLKLDASPQWARYIGSAISVTLSLPLTLVDRSYPYWAMGPAYFTLMLVIATLLMHTAVVYISYTSIKKGKSKF